ncbi:MAG: hypothetical protein JRH10_09250, partial [Deltaproteobacteria bacterium]|nr:hypothetical protein [Deltaproteobacteria bacterium]
LEARLREIFRSAKRKARDVRSLASAMAAAIQGVYQMDALAPSTAKRGSSAPAVRHMVAGLIDAQPRRAAQPRRSK